MGKKNIIDCFEMNLSKNLYISHGIDNKIAIKFNKT